MPERPEIIEDFSRYLGLERGLSANTKAAYAGDALAYVNFCAAGGFSPEEATPEFLDDYLWEIKKTGRITARTLFRKMESLRAFYRFFLVDGKIPQDPTRHFRAPKMPARLPQSLSLEDVERLISYPSDEFPLARTKMIIELFYAAGLRVSELLGLRLESLNLDHGWVLVHGKGGKERIVPVNPEACRSLEKYLELRHRLFSSGTTDSELFLNRFGRKLSRVQVWSDINRLGKLAGIKHRLHPHLFRHTFASHLLRGGADLRSLQEMLGHASLATTQIYTHLDKDDLKRTHHKYHPRNAS